MPWSRLGVEPTEQSQISVDHAAFWALPDVAVTWTVLGQNRKGSYLRRI